MILRNAKGIRCCIKRVFDEYSCLVFGLRLLVKWMSLQVLVQVWIFPRHFVSFEISFKTSSEHSELNLRLCPKYISQAHRMFFKSSFANGLLRYLIVLRSKMLNNGIIRYSLQTSLNTLSLYRLTLYHSI